MLLVEILLQIIMGVSMLCIVYSFMKEGRGRRNKMQRLRIVANIVIIAISFLMLTASVVHNTSYVTYLFGMCTWIIVLVINIFFYKTQEN